MNIDTDQVNDTICPICEKSNLCQAHQPELCWCHSTKVPQSIINKVPPQQQRKNCICQNCIEQFNFALATRKT